MGLELPPKLTQNQKSYIFAFRILIFTDMARNRRKKSETGVYHVMPRGIKCQGIFGEGMNAES